MEALIVVVLTLVGMTLLEPTERQVSRARTGRGRLRERLAVLRRLGLVRH